MREFGAVFLILDNWAVAGRYETIGGRINASCEAGFPASRRRWPWWAEPPIAGTDNNGGFRDNGRGPYKAAGSQALVEAATDDEKGAQTQG